MNGAERKKGGGMGVKPPTLWLLDRARLRRVPEGKILGMGTRADRVEAPALGLLHLLSEQLGGNAGFFRQEAPGRNSLLSRALRRTIAMWIRKH